MPDKTDARLIERSLAFGSETGFRGSIKPENGVEYHVVASLTDMKIPISRSSVLTVSVIVLLLGERGKRLLEVARTTAAVIQDVAQAVRYLARQRTRRLTQRH